MPPLWSWTIFAGRRSADTSAGNSAWKHRKLIGAGGRQRSRTGARRRRGGSTRWDQINFCVRQQPPAPGLSSEALKAELRAVNMSLLLQCQDFKTATRHSHIY
ncbi:uncharacterized protein V6R79_001685 [Siganus canaliculatus]